MAAAFYTAVAPLGAMGKAAREVSVSDALIGRVNPHHNFTFLIRNQILKLLRGASNGPIIPVVARRIHVPKLRSGPITLDESEAHHLRDVLRLTPGTEIELFDNAGATAVATIRSASAGGVQVDVGPVTNQVEKPIALTVASAVPKGDRADWMVEKLSELGVATFIPISSERSVVHPTGKGKTDRWHRIAIESAKQSRRSGVMKISDLTSLESLIKPNMSAWFLSTGPNALSIRQLLINSLPSVLTLFIGPEGGWTDNESTHFNTNKIPAAALTQTVLRVETAAITAAAVVLCSI